MHGPREILRNVTAERMRAVEEVGPPTQLTWLSLSWQRRRPMPFRQTVPLAARSSLSTEHSSQEVLSNLVLPC